MDILNGSMELKLKKFKTCYEALSEAHIINDPIEAMKIVQTAHNGLENSNSAVPNTSYFNDNTEISTSNLINEKFMDEKTWQDQHCVTLNYEESHTINSNPSFNEPNKIQTNLGHLVDSNSKSQLNIGDSLLTQIKDVSKESNKEYSKSNLLSNDIFVLLEKIDNENSWKTLKCTKYVLKEPVVLTENIEKKNSGLHFSEREKKQMRYNNRNKSQFLKNKESFKIQEIVIRKNIKTITHKKNWNLSTKNKENFPEKIKKAIETNTVIRNTINYSSPLEIKQSNIIKSKDYADLSKKLKKDITNKAALQNKVKIQIRNNFNENNYLLLKNKGNNKNEENNKKNLNKITCKKNMNISQKKCTDLSKTLKKGESLNRKRKQLKDNTEGTKSLFLKNKCNNKKQKSCGRKDISTVDCKKSINFNPKRKKDSATKLDKTVKNKSVTLIIDKKQMKNKMNRTKPPYLKKKENNKKKSIDGKKNITTVNKKVINFCPKQNKILAKKIKKTVDITGISLKKEKIQMKNKIKGTKPIYLKNKGNNEKQDNCSLKKKGNNKKMEKYGKKSINSVFCKKAINLSPKNKKELSKKLKKTQINNGASLKRDKQKKRNDINGTKNLSIKQKGSNKKKGNYGMKKINTAALKKYMNLYPKNIEDLSEKNMRIISNNNVITTIEKDAKVQLVRLSESLITRYCLTALKSNTTQIVPSNHERKRTRPSRNSTKKNCCSLCCKTSIINGISKKIKNKTVNSNTLITNQMNNLNSLRSNEFLDNLRIEKNVRVQLVRLNESLITNTCLSAKNKKRKGLSVNHAKKKAKISKNMTNKKMNCSLRLKKSIIKSVSNIKRKKTINDNAVISNLIDGFSSFTLKDIDSKFEMKKEARVQLVRLRESLITNYSLSQVKKNKSQCVSLNSINKKAEISKNKTNNIRYSRQDPNESITKDISDKNEICDDISKAEPLSNIVKGDDSNISVVAAVKINSVMDSNTKIFQNKVKNDLTNRNTEILVVAPVKTNSVMDSDTRIVHCMVQNDLTNGHHTEISVIAPVKTNGVMVSDSKIVHSNVQNDLTNRHHNISVVCKRPLMEKIPIVVMKRHKLDSETMDSDKESKGINGKPNHITPLSIALKSKEQKIYQNQGKDANHHKEVRVVVRRLKEDIIKKHQGLLSNPSSESSKVFKKTISIKSRNKNPDQTKVSLKRRNSKKSELSVNYVNKSSMMNSDNSIDHSNISNILKKKFDKKKLKSCISIKNKSAKNGNCLNSAFKVFCTSQLSYDICNANN